MSVSVKIDLKPTAEILAKRGLERNGKAQRYATHEARRLMDPYVPMLTGTMKNIAVENADNVTYPAPYSRKQFHENKGRGQRGKRWDRRMMAAKGKALVSAIAAFVGGKAK